MWYFAILHVRLVEEYLASVAFQLGFVARFTGCYFDASAHECERKLDITPYCTDVSRRLQEKSESTYHEPTTAARRHCI
jgi:hypothetical protein